jgi:serine/threonine-protein kinase
MGTARSAASGELRAGEQLGPYRLDALLGEGQMGVVFRARREGNGEVVALKVLRDELAGDELYRRRFEREARIASEIAHEHIVPVVDFGQASGRLYLAALYVAGIPLSERIASPAPISLAEALSLVNQLAGALEAIHARGLVHRDVKPANVIVGEDGTAALTDFGLARGIAETVLTKPGTVVGTVEYLAPELIRGEPPSATSDVYALGCLFYECLAGAPPFAGKGLVETLLAHVREEPPELTKIRPELPEDTCWAALRALAKDPEERPPTAKTYARLLRASARAR